MKRIILILCVLCVLCGSIYAANEIRAYYPSGSSLYAVQRNSTGQAFDTTGNAFEAWNVMTDYDIALTDHSGGMYTGTLDVDTPAGSYTIIVYKQMGVNPADSDPPIQFEEGYWTGLVWKSSRDRLEDIVEDTGTTLDTDIQSILSNQTVINNNITDSNSNIMEEISGLKNAMDANFAAIDFDTSGIDANFVTLRNAIDANFAGNLSQISDLKSQMDVNFAEIIEDTGTTIPAQINDVNNYLDSVLSVSSVAISDLKSQIDANFASVDANFVEISAEITSLKYHMDSNFANIEIDANGITIDPDAFWDEVIEGTYTARQLMRLISSQLFGKTTGGGTARIRFRDLLDTKNRIDATVDSKDNRLNVILNAEE